MVTFSASDVGIFVQTIQADGEIFFSSRPGSHILFPPGAYPVDHKGVSYHIKEN